MPLFPEHTLIYNEGSAAAVLRLLNCGDVLKSVLPIYFLGQSCDCQVVEVIGAVLSATGGLLVWGEEFLITSSLIVDPTLLQKMQLRHVLLLLQFIQFVALYRVQAHVVADVGCHGEYD